MANFLTRFFEPFEMTLRDAPPAVRFLDIAAAPLEREIKNPQGVVSGYTAVGSFIAKLKVLADASELECQREEAKWYEANPAFRGNVEAFRHACPDLYLALYRADHTRKSTFELAIVPSFHVTDIEKRMVREYKYRRNYQLPLPAPISKYRLGADYLENIGQFGLRQKSFPLGIKINIKNPPATLSSREKSIHYLGVWTSWILTLTAVATVGLTTPWLFALCAAGMFYAKKTGNDFAMFDVAETLHRDVGWLFSRKFAFSGKFSLRKSLETLLHLTALGVAVYFAVIGAWTGALALPIWGGLSSVGLTGIALEAMQISAGVFLSGVAAAATWAGVSFPIRFFWGFSIWDNQVNLTQEIANALPAIDASKNLLAAFARQLNKAMNKIVKPVYGLSVNQLEQLQALNVAHLEQKRALLAQFAIRRLDLPLFIDRPIPEAGFAPRPVRS